jgi:hypothetical protein
LELFSRIEVLLLFLVISWRVQRVNLVILHIVVVTVLHQLLLLLCLPPGLRQVFDLLWGDSCALLGDLLIVLLWQLLLQLLLLLSCISLNNWICSLQIEILFF